jgi:hypothetical protein
MVRARYRRTTATIRLNLIQEMFPNPVPPDAPLDECFIDSVGVL